jgi:hypothetical protein
MSGQTGGAVTEPKPDTFYGGVGVERDLRGGVP